MTDELSSEQRQRILELYKLYVERVMKEGELIWTRFSLYLSLNSGIVVVAGILFKDYLKDLPFSAPPSLWLLSSFLFVIGVFLGQAWEKANLDGARWQRVIGHYIASLEPALFEGGGGLYTAFVAEAREEHENKKSKKEDVVWVNVRVARLFKWVWLVSTVLSFVFFSITVLRNLRIIVW